MYEKSFTDKDLEIIRNLEYERFAELSTRSCCYSNLVIKMYSEMLWQESMDKQSQLDGFNDSPKVSCTKLVFPTNTSRKIETLVLSFLYPNNLMNEFLYRYNKSEFFSPLCVCEEKNCNEGHFRMHTFPSPLRLWGQPVLDFVEQNPGILCTTY